MKIFLTQGMNGKKMSLIGTETDDVKKVIEYIVLWKNDEINKKSFKIESYDRFIFGDSSIIVDFGDYCYFIEITDVDELKKDQFKGI